MNRVEFLVVPESGGTAAEAVEPRLDIKVDGVPLEELARRVELRPAKADRQENLAGTYTGLAPLEAVCWPSRHFLGSPALSWFGDGDTVLLGCTCGEWGCWPLCAGVRVSDEHVTWDGFRNGHRTSWDLGDLGPFVFDRSQYEAALKRTQLD